MLFHRLALSKDKTGVLEMLKGSEVEKAEDLIRDPYVFEFLGIEPKEQYLEGELEQRLIQT